MHSASQTRIYKDLRAWSPKLEQSAENSNSGPQVGTICGTFQLGAPCRINLRNFSTWSSMSDQSAELFNLELHVGSICGTFQLGAQSWIDLRKSSTWSSMSEKSAENFNLAPQVEGFRESCNSAGRCH